MRIGLKGKSYFIVTLICVLMFIGNGFAVYSLNRESTYKVEKMLLEDNLNRAGDAFVKSTKALQSLCRDWAWWNDSYNFLDEFNEEFVDSNLTPDVWTNLNVDIILFIDDNGDFYFSHSVEGMDSVEDCFLTDGCAGEKIISNCGLRGLSGLARINHRLMQISAQKIMPSAIEGTPRGTLVMGRFWGDQQLDKLGKDLHMNLEFQDLTGSSENLLFSTFGSDDTEIEGSKVLRGVFSQPLVRLSLSMKRDVYEIERSLLKVYVCFMFGSLFLLGVATTYILNASFVSRVKLLKEQLRDEYFTGPEKRKLKLSGNDELNDLSDSINKILVLLQEERNKAETASRVKTEFLANMSHEIRTPMHSILGMVELLKETKIDDEQREFVNIAGTAGENLLEIINDVLEISKIEAGYLEIENYEFLLHEMIKRVVGVFAVDAARKGLKVICLIDEDIPDRVTGDATRIRQVLNNLISNAVKFTGEGQISVSLYFEDGKIFFAVRDEGVGISEDKLGYIFKSFTQADSSTSRKYGGTGLGLAISRKLVEMMGGEIFVSSTVGEGTTFRFYVNLDAV